MINGLDFAIWANNLGRNNETDPNTFGSYVGSDVNNFNAYADINRSGTVDYDDLNIFKTYFKLQKFSISDSDQNLWFLTFPGDLNLDGRVGLDDFAYLSADWNATDVNSVADISGPNGIPDKNVDYWDLSAFGDDYLRDINEPGTWWIYDFLVFLKLSESFK